MKKKVIALIAVAALSVSALTGCGSKKDDSAQSGDNSGGITINYPPFLTRKPLPRLPRQQKARK